MHNSTQQLIINNFVAALIITIDLNNIDIHDNYIENHVITPMPVLIGYKQRKIYQGPIFTELYYMLVKSLSYYILIFEILFNKLSKKI